MLETIFQLWSKPIYSSVMKKVLGQPYFITIIIIFLIIKKIKTNIISVSGEKRFAFEKMQLHQIGTNTCRLFIIVTIIFLCG